MWQCNSESHYSITDFPWFNRWMFMWLSSNLWSFWVTNALSLTAFAVLQVVTINASGRRCKSLESLGQGFCYGGKSGYWKQLTGTKRQKTIPLGCFLLASTLKAFPNTKARPSQQLLLTQNLSFPFQQLHLLVSIYLRAPDTSFEQLCCKLIPDPGPKVLQWCHYCCRAKKG